MEEKKSFFEYKRLPKQFYEKERPTISNKESFSDLYPVELSEECRNGKRKIKVTGVDK